MNDVTEVSMEQALLEEKELAKQQAREAKAAEKEVAKAEKAAEKEAVKQAKLAEKEAAKAAKQETPVEKPAKEARLEQNGIKRPKEGTVTGNIWLLADALSETKGAPVSIAELKLAESADGTEVNPATLSTQYAAWRKFNGVLGRVANPNSTVKTTSLDKLKIKVDKAYVKAVASNNAYVEINSTYEALLKTQEQAA